jgi:hypothetical protein
MKKPSPSLTESGANLTEAQERLLSCVWPCINSALSDWNTCGQCVQRIVDCEIRSAHAASEVTYPGMNGIPADYVVDMLSLLGGYPEAFCNGQVQGCRIKNNFPGSRSTSIMGWDSVKAMVEQTPEKEWSGEWWRGNELGFIINNQFFWKGNNIWPRSILLGATPRQHAAVRPFLEELFMLERMSSSSVENRIRTMTRNFFQQRLDAADGRGSLRIPQDITAFVHQVLMKVAFGRSVSWSDAQHFVSLQSQLVKLGTFSQLFPESVHNLWFMTDIVAGVESYVSMYHSIVQNKFGNRLTAKDPECAPSSSCAWQLASGVWDTMYSAGGLSTPTNLGTGLGLIYSNHRSSPFRDARHVDFSNAAKARVFMWENHRYFAPVVGFPHWTKRPKCHGTTQAETDALNKTNGETEACPMRGDDVNQVNQYQGGTREVPNLALAQLDPAKWGSNAHQFRMRHESEYLQKNQGFADFAVNDAVAEGGMNRVCPGKSLDLKIGEIFFQVFNEYKDKFDSPSSDVTFGGGPSWVGAFELERKCVCGARQGCQWDRWMRQHWCWLDTDKGCTDWRYPPVWDWYRGKHWSLEPCRR